MNKFRGTPNKDGRPKGAKNKVNTTIRDAFTLLLENNIEQLQSDLDKLHPLNRVKLILELATFVIPKLKSIEMSGEIENDKTQPLIIHFDFDNDN
jgi:hypothetical protein